MEYAFDSERDLDRDANRAVAALSQRAVANVNKTAIDSFVSLKLRQDDLEREAFLERAISQLPPTTLAQARNDAVERLLHRNGCRCPLCDPTEYTCVRCGEVITGKLHYGRHIAAHKRSRKRRVVLQPDGIGFVRKLVYDDKKSWQVHLGALTRFQRMLIDAQPTKRRGVTTQLDRALLADLETKAPGTPVKLPRAHATAASAAVVYKLAILAGVSPQAVTGALLTYGLERLADELRTSKTAPAVHVPHIAVQDKPSTSTPFFPTREG